MRNAALELVGGALLRMFVHVPFTFRLTSVHAVQAVDSTCHTTTAMPLSDNAEMVFCYEVWEQLFRGYEHLYGWAVKFET